MSLQFAIALSWWALALVAMLLAVVAWASYARSIVPLAPRRRATLTALRALTLALLVACLLRPVRVLPPDTSEDNVVPVLVDVSRSMRLADAEGSPRIETAERLVSGEIVPALAGTFRTEVWTFGDALARRPETSAAGGGPLSADAGRSDLSAALQQIRERYRERRVPGIVVISDGGDTGAREAAVSAEEAGVPVHTVGVGAARIDLDLEVLDVSAGEAVLADSSVDVAVTAVSRGRAAPFDLRVLENGRPIDVRRVRPAGSGSPVREVFTVSPSRETATVYTIEIPSASGELVRENNRRSVVVEPPGRRRLVLIVEGAPGFEHSFLKRALASDPGIELDSVVRKGRDARGDATYFVQAPADRAPRLTLGFPDDRAALYRYDAVILANLEPDALSGVQLEALADFVGRRGGGLLTFGAKSFAQRGFAGTPIESVLPVRLQGGDGVLRASARGRDQFSVALTADGETHPVTRIGESREATAKRWSALPALAGASSLGAPRPGAQILATVRTIDGARPLIAVQRYGRGRSMIFAGEASWRWRMRMASTDRSFELFWRQATRWVASGAPERVVVAPPSDLGTGDRASLAVEVLNETYEGVADALVSLRVIAPDGAATNPAPTLADAKSGRYSTDMQVEQPGLYRVSAEARRGNQTVASSQRWFLVGGVDRELSDPRLNEDVLRRISHASGGTYVAASEISRLPSLLQPADDERGSPRVVELWHNGWVFALAILLLSAEWMLRRTWGLK